MVQFGGLVNITALFPIMNATDNLAAVADLIEIRPRTKNAHITSLSGPVPHGGGVGCQDDLAAVAI